MLRVVLLPLALGIAAEARSLWRPTASMKHPRWSFATGVMHDALYAVGGQMGDLDATIIPMVEKYNSTTEVWVPVANMSSARVGHGVAAVSSRLYAVSGWNDACGSIACASVEAFDPSENAWSSVPPLTFPRDHAAVVGLWGKLYVMGGCNGWDADGHCTNLTASVEVFNVAHNNWSMAAPMPTARWGLGATVWRGKIIAMGGEAANLTRLSTVEEYDVATNRWRSKAPMPEPRAWFGVGAGAFPAEEGTVYVVGGCNEQSCADPLSSMLGYRPAHDAWFTMPSEFELPQPRFEFSLAVLGGDRLCALGGLHNQNASQTFASVEVLQVV